MDEDWHVCVDLAQPHLLESSSEFTVVACIGAQGVGKSTALSLLLASFQGALVKEKGKSNGSPDGDNAGEGGNSGGLQAEASPGIGAVGSGNFRLPLEVKTLEAWLKGASSTAGVEICVSAFDRLLLLDVQPLFCYDVMSQNEVNCELHLLLFLTSICHTLLVVMDTAVDLHLLGFLQRLAVLKSKAPDLGMWVEKRPHLENGHPTEKLPSNGVLPRLVVAFNNIGSHLCDEDLFRPAQDFLRKSPWKAAPSFQCVRIPRLPGGSLAAMFTSPEAWRAGLRLRECILCAGPARGRFGKDGLQLTEREWLYHISEYWEFVLNVSIVQEYADTISKSLKRSGGTSTVR